MILANLPAVFMDPGLKVGTALRPHRAFFFPPFFLVLAVVIVTFFSHLVSGLSLPHSQGFSSFLFMLYRILFRITRLCCHIFVFLLVFWSPFPHHLLSDCFNNDFYLSFCLGFLDKLPCFFGDSSHSVVSS